MAMAFIEKAKKATLASLKFDYATIEDPQARKKAQDAALRIRENITRSKQVFFDIGRDLLEMKEEIMHGGFQLWLSAEFPQLKYRTAVNYMRAYEFCKENPEAKELDITALYELASKSTPQEVVMQVLEQVKTGTAPTIKEIKAKKEPEAAAELGVKALTQPEVKVIEIQPIHVQETEMNQAETAITFDVAGFDDEDPDWMLVIVRDGPLELLFLEFEEEFVSKAHGIVNDSKLSQDQKVVGLLRTDAQRQAKEAAEHQAKMAAKAAKAEAKAAKAKAKAEAKAAKEVAQCQLS